MITVFQDYRVEAPDYWGQDIQEWDTPVVAELELEVQDLRVSEEAIPERVVLYTIETQAHRVSNQTTPGPILWNQEAIDGLYKGPGVLAHCMAPPAGKLPTLPGNRFYQLRLLELMPERVVLYTIETRVHRVSNQTTLGPILWNQEAIDDSHKEHRGPARCMDLPVEKFPALPGNRFCRLRPFF